MDTFIPLIGPPTVLVKDFSDKINWNAIYDNFQTQEFEKNNGYHISKNKNFFIDIPEISNCLAEEAKQFIFNTSIIDFEFDLTVTKSWCNGMSKGDQHPWHTHPFSVVSGVLFLDDHIENGNLTFKLNSNDRLPPYSALDIDYYVSLQELVGEESLKNHLVLFYSNVLHGVPVSNVGQRRTISFNTFWRGELKLGADLSSHDFK